MPNTTPFHFQNAVKAFGSRAVLTDFNLNLEPGEFTVLLGSSGCGKSTVLRLLAGLEELTAGTVSRPQDSRLSFVFQEPRLLPWRTVQENVLLPFELSGAEKPDPRPWLEKVGLLEARDLYPHQLSGGMRMRTSLARALITNPSVLLLDEPLSALDEVTREDLQTFILKLWREQSFTAVFVTHSLREAVYLGRRLIIMSRDGGRILHDERLAEFKGPEDFRTSSEFQATVARLSARFRESLREAK